MESREIAGRAWNDKVKYPATLNQLQAFAVKLKNAPNSKNDIAIVARMKTEAEANVSDELVKEFYDPELRKLKSW